MYVIYDIWCKSNNLEIYIRLESVSTIFTARDNA